MIENANSKVLIIQAPARYRIHPEELDPIKERFMSLGPKFKAIMIVKEHSAKDSGDWTFEFLDPSPLASIVY